MNRFEIIVPKRSTVACFHLVDLARLSAMARAQDSNPSGFTAHRETGNPIAVQISVPTSQVVAESPVGTEWTGHGGETPSIFLEARKRALAPRERIQPGSVVAP